MAEMNSPQAWQRSGRCENASCVEVAFSADRDRVYLRNSREPAVHVEVSANAWRTFRAAVAAGEFDQPAVGAD
jgi:Domain of unknown function (DUF397)